MTSKSASRRSSLAFERILDVAVEQIAAEGMQGVRLAQIAKEAGVSVSLIHYHFATREALLEEALIHAYTRADRERDMWERAQASLTRAQRLTNMVELMLPGADEHHVQEWRLWFELWMQAVRTPELQRVAGSLYARWQAWWIEAIEAGIAARQFKRCDPRSVADRVLALIDGFGVRVQIDPNASTQWARGEVLDYLAGVLGPKSGLANMGLTHSVTAGP
jgi:AcrR family transcriptional regulator